MTGAIRLPAVRLRFDDSADGPPVGAVAYDQHAQKVTRDDFWRPRQERALDRFE